MQSFPQIPNLDWLNASAEILKGGGTRRFFRVKFRGNAAIACIYDDSKHENFLYADIAKWLAKIGVPAPEIFYHSREQHLLVMEDLGETDLFSLQKSRSRDWKIAYFSALKSLAKLHQTPMNALAGTEILRDGFNEKYYAWEQNYFLENAVQNGKNLVPAPELLAELSQLTGTLCAQPPQFLHRDCQSQNIMWHRGNAVFIDFQGMRVGTGFYDVASLIFDPYVELDERSRDEFFAFYCEQIGVPADSRSRELFHLAAAERLMQALGAYYFLSTKMGKPRYLQFVVPALKNLELVTRDSLPELHKLSLAMLAK